MAGDQNLLTNFGLLANCSLSIPLLKGCKSKEESHAYFKNQSDMLYKGCKLIPDRLEIRLLTGEEIAFFKKNTRIFYKWFENQGNCLIEWKYEGETGFAQKYEPIFKTFLALRLLKKDPIYLGVVYSVSPLNNQIVTWLETDPIPFPWSISGPGVYRLYPSDFEKLKQLVHALLRIDFDEDRTFRIAGDRFGRSYHNRYYEDSLIDLCIGFDTFYLKGAMGRRKRHNRGTKIADRCANFLEEDNRNKKNIKKIIERGFKLRNNVVHGSEYDLNEVRHKVEEMTDLLRRSIVKKLESVMF